MTHLEIVPVTHESKLGDFFQQTRPIEKCILLEGRHVACVRPFLPELIQIIIFHLDPYWPTARRRSLLLFPHILSAAVSTTRSWARCLVLTPLLYFRTFLFLLLYSFMDTLRDDAPLFFARYSVKGFRSRICQDLRSPHVCPGLIARFWISEQKIKKNKT